MRHLPHEKEKTERDEPWVGKTAIACDPADGRRNRSDYRPRHRCKGCFLLHGSIEAVIPDHPRQAQQRGENASAEEKGKAAAGDEHERESKGVPGTYLP